ncbi:MAG: secondary thiamine-phosphate synthase enzyme YjbQ [Porphyromonadaceae bacterium]|nr:secondary thiamine-phosphate synthase enzyme YjbQ [Porphyromonadaceae bacterium]
MIRQQLLVISACHRGYHLITALIEKALGDLPETGLLHLFLQHTSAALTINENADPAVRRDFESAMNRLVPEGNRYYTHTLEGDDDMPAHLKSSLIGPSLTLPVRGGRLALGTWQGIYLCEFRDEGGDRRILATLYY